MITDQIKEQFPLHTQIGYVVFTNRAVIELNCKNPSAAIELLRPTSPNEFIQGNSLLADYIRGLANLRLHLAKDGASDFQELLDHPGIVLNNVHGALARLGLAGAYVPTRGVAKSHAAHQDFLTLWNDAGPDVPIFKEAKPEYAEIH